MPIVKVVAYVVASAIAAVFVVMVLGYALVWELARRDQLVPYSRLCGKPIEVTGVTRGTATRTVFCCRQPRGHAGECDRWPADLTREAEAQP